jgi:flagellar hook assembly protein FlgD
MHVTLRIYDLLGQEVASLVDEDQVNGSHTVEWNGRSTRGTAVSSGVYFYRLAVQRADGGLTFLESKKMLLLK